MYRRVNGYLLYVLVKPGLFFSVWIWCPSEKVTEGRIG